MATCNDLKVIPVKQCGVLPDWPKQIFLGKIKDSTGAYNEFASIEELTDANFKTKKESTDYDSKLFILSGIKNATFEETEANYREWDDGSRDFVSEGTLGYTGIVKDQTFGTADAIRAFARANGLGIMLLDNKNQLTCQTDKETKRKVRFMPIDSIYSQLMGLASGRSQEGNLSISMDASLDFDLIRTFKSDDYPADLSNIEELTPCQGTISNETVNGFDISIFTVQGKNVYIDDLVSGNIAVVDEVGSPVTLSSFTYNTTKKAYEATYTTPVTSGDILYPTVSDITDPKVYDFGQVNVLTINTP